MDNQTQNNLKKILIKREKYFLITNYKGNERLHSDPQNYFSHPPLYIYFNSSKLRFK